MKHYGENEVTFKNGETMAGAKSQVTGAKKPLLAARRLVERGNAVRFGSGPGENYIRHVETGRAIPMEKQAASFVIQADFAPTVQAAAPGFTRQAR